MARRARRRTPVIWALLTLIGLLPGTAPAAARSTPRGVVRQYLAALAAHDARGVCATFSPQLRLFESRWEPATRRASCAKRVAAAHFAAFSPGSLVRRIQVRRVTVSAPDAAGNVAVRAVLFYRFPCTGGVSVIPGCRPHFEQRRDVFYLRSQNGRWSIVKPGLIYEQTSSIAPPFGLDMLTPPAGRSTVDRTASIAEPPILCPGGGVSAADPRNVRAAPWLDITHVSIVRLARQSLCVTITLAGPPRADSSYMVDLDQARDGGETIDSYGLTIDGFGGLHPRLADAGRLYARRAGTCPSAFGLVGDQLVMILSPGDAVFRSDRTIDADAATASLQPGEPLLRNPLDAQDTAPRFLGLRVAPATSHDRARCAALSAMA